MSWNDFNAADDQNSYDPLPAGTLVKVRMTIKPGGCDDPAQGWTGGYATRNNDTGVMYLNCEFVVLEGPYAKRKIWSNIGLFSPKGPDYGNMGRSFIKGILNSARGLDPKDMSPQAQNLRRINGLSDLDGLVFVGRVEVGKDKNGNQKNEIRVAITPTHKDYAALMGTIQNVAAPSSSQPTATAFTRPSWAQ